MPDKKFVLIDSNGKKTRFLTQAKIDLKLDNVEVIHQRVEDYHPETDGHRIYFDVITARAYASTDDILSSTEHLQSQETQILIMQGKQDNDIGSDSYEIVETNELDVYGLEAERHLLEVKKK